ERKFKKPASPKLTIVPASPNNPQRSQRELRDLPRSLLMCQQQVLSSEILLGADFKAKVLDDSKAKSSDISEGTGVKPGVLYVCKADSFESDNESWEDIVMDALALTLCYSAFLTTVDVPEIYMHQFRDSIHKHDTSYRFRMDRKKKFYLNLETFRDIFQSALEYMVKTLMKFPLMKFPLMKLLCISSKNLVIQGKSSQSSMLLLIRCINLKELLLLSSTEIYLERHPVLINFILLEHKSFKECTIRRMWTMLNYFRKLSLTRLTIEVTKRKRRCTTLDSPKLSFTTSFPKTRQSLGETR
nr:hypothetical protein [Tanacetum cinerariifolium]